MFDCDDEPPCDTHVKAVINYAQCDVCSPNSFRGVKVYIRTHEHKSRQNCALYIQMKLLDNVAYSFANEMLKLWMLDTIRMSHTPLCLI